MKNSTDIAVSVILPVYNVADYLDECLRSLEMQTLKNIEIICVDDGSTDGSSAILAQHAEKDSRLKVIRQVNAGAGAARNAGLDVARGEYLAFFDSDDFCPTDTLEKLYRRSSRLKLDVVVFTKLSYDDNLRCVIGERSIPRKVRSLKQPFSPEQIAPCIFNSFGHTAWNKLFRAEFIRQVGLRFQPLPLYNDMYFVSLAMVKARRLGVCNHAYYIYRDSRVGSLQFTKDKSPNALYQAYDAILDELRKIGGIERFGSSYVRSVMDSGFLRITTLKDPKNVLPAYCALREHLLSFASFYDYRSDASMSDEKRQQFATIVENETPEAFFLIAYSKQREKVRRLGADAYRFRKAPVRTLLRMLVRQVLKRKN